MEKKHSEGNERGKRSSERRERAALIAATANTASRIATLALLSVLTDHKDLAADLDDINNRLIVLLEKYSPGASELVAGPTFFAKIKEEIKQRDIENLTKEKN